MREMLGDWIGEASPGVQVDPFQQVIATSSEEDEDLTDMEQETKRPCNTNGLDGASTSVRSATSPDAQRQDTMSSQDLHGVVSPSEACYVEINEAPTTRQHDRPHLRGRRRPRKPSKSNANASGRVMTQLEVSRRIFAEYEERRIRSEEQQAASIQGILEVLKNYSVESLEIQRQQAEAVMRFAVAAERRASVAERQLEFENECNSAQRE